MEVRSVADFARKRALKLVIAFDCEKLLCSDCLNAHEVFKTAAFQGHKVTPVKQFQAEDYEALLKAKGILFSEVPRERSNEILLSCLSNFHLPNLLSSRITRIMKSSRLKRLQMSERANILAGAELMKQKHEACSDVIRQFEEIVASLETNIAAAKRQVSRAAEQMIAAIHESEREAITTLENTRLSRMDEIKRRKETS